MLVITVLLSVIIYLPHLWAMFHNYATPYIPPLNDNLPTVTQIPAGYNPCPSVITDFSSSCCEQISSLHDSPTLTIDWRALVHWVLFSVAISGSWSHALSRDWSFGKVAWPGVITISLTSCVPQIPTIILLVLHEFGTDNMLDIVVQKW